MSDDARSPEEKGDDLLKDLGYAQEPESGVAYGVISFCKRDINPNNPYPISEDRPSFVPGTIVTVIDPSGGKWSTKWVDGRLMVDERLPDEEE